MADKEVKYKITLDDKDFRVKLQGDEKIADQFKTKLEGLGGSLETISNKTVDLGNKIGNHLNNKLMNTVGIVSLIDLGFKALSKTIGYAVEGFNDFTDVKKNQARIDFFTNLSSNSTKASSDYAEKLAENLRENYAKPLVETQMSVIQGLNNMTLRNNPNLLSKSLNLAYSINAVRPDRSVNETMEQISAALQKGGRPLTQFLVKLGDLTPTMDKQIKSYEKLHDTIGYTSKIIDLFSDRYKEGAEAVVKADPLAQLKIIFDKIKLEMGETLLKVFTDNKDVIQNFFTDVEHFIKTIKKDDVDQFKEDVKTLMVSTVGALEVSGFILRWATKFGKKAWDVAMNDETDENIKKQKYGYNVLAELQHFFAPKSGDVEEMSTMKLNLEELSKNLVNIDPNKVIKGEDYDEVFKRNGKDIFKQGVEESKLSVLVENLSKNTKQSEDQIRKDLSEKYTLMGLSTLAYSPSRVNLFIQDELKKYLKPGATGEGVPPPPGSENPSLETEYAKVQGLRPININITMDSMVKQLSFNTTNLQESTDIIEDQIIMALSDAITTAQGMAVENNK
jgi:hypothetical protein